MLYGRRFPLRLKGAAYKSYVRPAILYGSVAWCQKESEMGILRWSERSMVMAMCRVQLKNRKRHKDLMLGLNETIDLVAMASSVRWYGHVLRRALDFEVDGQRKTGRLKRSWKREVEEESGL